MNHYADLERMRNAIEELSLRKQLPLRQQTDKPILRYDMSMTKPVQLFNQGDTLPCRDSRNGWDSQLAPSTGTVTGNTAEHSTPHHASSTPGQTKVRTASSGSSLSSPAKGVSNPYNRPVSAKEIIEDVHQKQLFRKFHPNLGSGQSSLSGSSSSLQHGDADSGVALQLNSFLRPQSGVRRDSVSTKQSPKRKPEQKGLAGSAGQAEHSPHTTTSTGRKKRVSEESQRGSSGPVSSTQSAKTNLNQAFALASTSSAAAGAHPALSSLPPRPKDTQVRKDKADAPSQRQVTTVRNPYYSPNKPYREMGSPQPNGSGKKVKPSDATGSKQHSSQSHSMQTSANITRGGKPKAPRDAKLPAKGLVDSYLLSQETSCKAGMEESGAPFHKVTASSLLNSKIGMLRKMPVTNTLTGTLYYKKSFREATRQVGQQQKKAAVLEHRPVGDGAPSKLSRVSADVCDEKGSHAEEDDEAEEEEDDDTSTPSGERQPGDGEASIEDLDDDDDGIDDIYEDSETDANDTNDADSDDYTISSNMSQTSSSTVRQHSAASRPSTTHSVGSRASAAGQERTRSFVRPVTSSGESMTQPALRQSLFPAIPPTINFVPEGEKVEQLPWEIRKFLKWRMSPITPNIVKSALGRINFRVTKKNHDWLGCFGKHMKAIAFKALREYQKLNHFPGSFQLGRKDRLWRNLSKMQVSFGKKEFGFFPQTYVLPQDLKQLKRTWEDSSSRQKWIIKPPASARGIGIKVINKWNQIPRRRPVIVQKYIGKPYLINDSKFDMRIYVYVTSYDPLRAYVFEDGLARFASCKYSSSMKNLSNKFMHLTNYSINKRNADYQSNTDDSVCQGHKWSLKSLWNYLKKQGINTQAVWDSIKDIVVKTLISAEGPINSMVKSSVRSRYIVHELFGFDILLDDQLRPFILEVNISPSLHSNSQLDINIKGQMIKDMMNLAGFRVPDKNDVHPSHGSSSAVDLSAHVPSNDYCMDKRLFTSQLAPDERAKHAYFCHRHLDEQVLQTILDILTPDDVRILTESIDEDSRKGGFIRVFPTPSTKKYLRFFEQPRYYNLMLDQWVTRYNRMEQRGIMLLQSLCEEGLHLENPTNNARHQWFPPNSSLLLSARDKLTSPLKKEGQGHGQVKSSPSQSRLPKVRSGTHASQSPSATVAPRPSGSFSTLSPSPAAAATQSRVARGGLDPSRGATLNAVLRKHPSYPVYDSLDELLAPEGRAIDYIEGDGNCFFRAVAKEMDSTEETHMQWRRRVCDEVEANPCVYPKVLKRPLYTFSPPSDNTDDGWLYKWLEFQPRTPAMVSNHPRYVTLCNTNGNHFDRVTPVDVDRCNCSLPAPLLEGHEASIDLTL
ncbi:hypothetical protein ACOMHN_029124 [Nucella lapillus]